MWAMLAATVVNIILDYIFIFIFEWGLFGAAIATDLGELVGTLLLLGYLLRSSVSVRFAGLKMSIKSIRLTLRNTWYMLKLGVAFMHRFRCCVRFADRRSVCLFLRRYRFLYSCRTGRAMPGSMRLLVCLCLLLITFSSGSM